MLLISPTGSNAGIDFADGANAPLNCGSGVSLDSLSDVTYSFWMFLNNNPDANEQDYIISKGDGTLQLENRLAGDTADKLVCRLRVTSGTESTTIVDTAFSENVWMHIVLVFDETGTGKCDVYLNGTEMGYDTHTAWSGTLRDASATDLEIGGIAAGFGIDGILDEFGMWTTVLSQAEITLLSSSRTRRIPLQVSPSNLVLYAPLDDVADGTSLNGETFLDLSGNGNTCTAGTAGTAKAGVISTYP